MMTFSFIIGMVVGSFFTYYIIKNVLRKADKEIVELYKRIKELENGK